ncbi:MAG: PilN domain-containing protein [Candidatus Korobacteraceae bacterium]
MIRINLLGVAKQKKRSGVPGPVAIKAPSIAVIAAGVALLTVGGNYAWYWMLDRESSQIRAQMQAEEEKNRRLADVRVKYMELEKQKNHYEHRVNVINELVSKKQGPTALLNTIAETVNRTDEVWLRTMKEEGNNINLEGIALSVNAVATLMQNLRGTGKFRTIEIKETFQDDVVRDVQAFVYSLFCEREQQPQKS